MVDEISLSIAIAALVVSIVAIIPLYLDYFARRTEKRLELEAEKRIDLEVERFQRPSIESDWGIRILNPSKTIEHCSTEIEWDAGMNVKLQLEDTKVYETKISTQGRASFRVPKGIVAEGSVIVVRDRTKEILRRKAQDVPLVNP